MDSEKTHWWLKVKRAAFSAKPHPEEHLLSCLGFQASSLEGGLAGGTLAPGVHFCWRQLLSPRRSPPRPDHQHRPSCCCVPPHWQRSQTAFLSHLLAGGNPLAGAVTRTFKGLRSMLSSVHQVRNSTETRWLQIYKTQCLLISFRARVLPQLQSHNHSLHSSTFRAVHFAL